MTDYIVRKGRATAKARRVMISPEGLQVGGFKNQIWHSGTKNVDIDDVNSVNYLYATNDAIGSYGYHQNTNTTIRYHTPTFGVYEWTGSTYRNFVRLFTVRENCKKLFKSPSNYRIFINKRELNLSTDLTQTNYYVPKVWQFKWGESIGDLYSVELSAIEVGTTSFTVEARSVTSSAIPNVLALQIYDGGSMIVNALLTFTADKVVIGYDIGLIAVKDFNFYTYKGKILSDLDASQFSVHRIGASVIRAYLESLP